MDEAAIVEQRIVARLASQAQLFQLAISTNPFEATSRKSAQVRKKAAENFQKIIGDMLKET